MQTFIENYLKGDYSHAFASVLSSPNVEYDRVQGESVFYRLLLNYIDALIFETACDVIYTGSALVNYLQDENISSLDRWQQILQFDQSLVQALKDHPEFYNEVEVESGLEFLNAFYEQTLTLKQFENLRVACRGPYLETLKKWWHYHKNCALWMQKNQKLLSYFENKTPPYYPISYPVEASSTLQEGNTIFMQSYAIDWEAVLEPFLEQQVIYVFPHTSDLFHCLQFDAVMQALDKGKVLVLQGDIESQISSFKIEKFIPIYLFDSPFRKQEEAIVAALNGKGKLDESVQSLHFKKLRYKYGKSRFFALQTCLTNALAFGKDKARPSCEMHLNSEASKDLQTLINAFPKRPKRTQNPLKRILHIVPHITDGHPNAKILYTFLRQAPKDCSIEVIFTERLSLRGWEYPIGKWSAPRSSEGGRETLMAIEQLGVPVHLDVSPTYIETIEWILEHLTSCDIGIFHCYDIMMRFILQVTDLPKKVFYEYEGLPFYPGFDLICARSEDIVAKYASVFEKNGTDISCVPEGTLPYQVDWCYQKALSL